MSRPARASVLMLMGIAVAGCQHPYPAHNFGGRPLVDPAAPQAQTHVLGALPADDGVSRASYDDVDGAAPPRTRVSDAVMLRDQGTAGYQDSGVPQ